MPKVLTHSEFKSLSLKNNFQPEEKPAEKPLTIQKEIQNEIKYDKEVKKEYVLLHPDNTVNQKVNGKFIVSHNDRMIEIPIIEGVIKTKDIQLRNMLMLKGMIFAYEKEIGG